MPSTASWTSRPDQQAMSPAELAALMDREAERCEGLLFTATPREELDGLGMSQRLLDQAFVNRARQVVALYNRLAREQREFAVDEIALALCMSPTGATKLLVQCLDLAAMPGMLEAIDAGLLGWQHATCMLRELDLVELTVEQRAAIGYLAIYRAPGCTPGEVMALTRRLILQIDPEAARLREQVATKMRQLLYFGAADGQAVTQLRGPACDQAAIKASIQLLKSEHPKPEGLTAAQWEYQLVLQLLTGEIRPGQWQAQVIVPFSTITGSSELELAELPGYGPILPSTARQLLEDAEWTQVAVDEHGVIAVGDPALPPTVAARPAAAPSATKPRMRDNWELSLAQLMSTPPKQRLMPEQLGGAAYATPSRLKRYLQARDRTCVFPGCHRRITDVDHRIPWPLGPTAADNLQLLCRHHHRAKQALFTVELTPDGDYLWISRGGWQFTRHRQGY